MVMCHEIKNFRAGIGKLKKKCDDIGKYTPPPGEVYDGFEKELRQYHNPVWGRVFSQFHMGNVSFIA
jgi:hypothetical protein